MLTSFGSLTRRGYQEVIRIAATTCSATLLPAHLQAISACWNELLLKSPIAERSKLIAFLTQLRPYFPHWKGEPHAFI